MERIKKFFVAIGMSALLTSCALTDKSKTESIVLADSKKANAAIIVGENSAEKKAARELQKYIKKIIGIELDIKKPGYAGKLKKIFISNGKTVQNFAIDLKKLKAQGFAIKTQNGNLALVGKDSDGTEFAVNFFLQKYCGVRWFFPGSLGTIVPEKKYLAVPEIDEIQNPNFLLREVGVKRFKKWRKHNLLGNSCPYYGGHSFHRFLPPEKYWESHPEYYAEIKGRRKKPEYLDNPKLRKWGEWQLCTSNPDVINQIAESVCKTFKDRPKLKAVAICPNDGSGFCECKKCRAFDQEADSITDRIFTFANAVAEKVAKKYPDKYLLMFAYSNYIKPPLKVKKIHPNIIVWYAYAAAMRSCDENKIKLEQLAQWGKLAKHIWIYEYFIVEGWKQHFPPFIIDILSWQIPYLYKNSVDGYITQSGSDWGMNGPHYYLTSQLLWDSSRNPEKIMDEYYSLLFEKAAPEIKKYFKIMEHAWNNNVKLPKMFGGVTDVMFMQIYPDSLLDKCRECFAKAESFGKNNSLILERIKRFRVGFKFLENHIAVLKSLKKAAGFGLPLGYDFGLGEGSFSPAEIKKSLLNAKKTIKEQLVFCEANKKTDLIGYEWLRNSGTNESHYIPRYQKKLKLIEQYLKSYTNDNKQLSCKLPGMWDFRLDKINEGLSQKWFAKQWLPKDTGKIRVPAFWNKTKKYENYGGVAWYRVNFEVPEEIDASKVVVKFGAVDAEADVYVNGILVDRHAYKRGSWKESFEFEISNFVKKGRNVLTVRVDGHGRNSGIWQPVSICLPGNNKSFVINGDFSDGHKGWSWSPYRDKRGEVAKPIIIESGTNEKGKCVMRNSPGQINQNTATRPGCKYKFSGWIKTENMGGESSADLYIAKGACKAGVLRNNSDWTFFEKTFTAKAPIAIVTLRQTGEGKAYFDNIKLIEIKEDKK